jgi:hypothetical protein
MAQWFVQGNSCRLTSSAQQSSWQLGVTLSTALQQNRSMQMQHRVRLLPHPSCSSLQQVRTLGVKCGLHVKPCMLQQSSSLQCMAMMRCSPTQQDTAQAMHPRKDRTLPGQHLLQVRSGRLRMRQGV